MNPQNTRSNPRMTPAVPPPPPFTFSSPTDTPAGARYRKTAEGFKADIPASSWLMAVIFGLISASLGFLLMAGINGEEGAPLSFVIFLAALSAITATFFAFFILGREAIEVRGNRLLLRKTLFGIGLSKSMHLHKLERAQVRNRSGTRGIGLAIYGTVKDQVLELEDDTHIRKMGSNLDSKHLYYLRYLILDAAKAFKSKAIL